MKIFAIADLHLSFNVDKPMNIFGDNWESHHEKIKSDWLKKVSDEDYVLLPGDISWGIDLKEADVDLKWIDDLPGKKIIIRGNHDYWWETLTKMKGLYQTIEFIHNTFVGVADTAICGTRGWISPNNDNFTEHDKKIYNRECNRLKLSLDAAKKAGYKKFIVMIHYPPTNEKIERSRMQEIIESYQVSTVVYGHLHTKKCHENCLKGNFNNVNYHLVACDYLDFKLKEIS